MTSIITNNSAMVALSTLRSVNSNLETTQNAVSSGLRISKASDNAAYWSIATTMKSDKAADSAVSDALGVGAAVIDTTGNIVAMAVPGPYHRVLGIPTATLESVVAKVDQFGHLPKPYIGIRLQPLWLDDDTRTKLGRKARGIAAVGGIDTGSPAEQAHIELGDLFLTLDGQPAESVYGIARRTGSATPSPTIT